MLNVFSPMSEATRSATRTAYREYLKARDGIPDVQNRVLPLREAAMDRFVRPLAKVRDLDRELFMAQYTRFDRQRRMSPEAQLLLTIVQINGAEAYAVNEAFQGDRRVLTGDAEIEATLHIEETYHTRILLSTAILYGLEVNATFIPPLPLRTLIGGITRGPEVLSRPLILAGEVMATTTFLNLLYTARTILRHDPELRDAIEERVLEILIDEVGHITFNRMLLGPAAMIRARMLLPLVAAGSAATLPVLRVLGLKTLSDDSLFVTTSPRLPEAVRKAAFVA